MEKFSVRAFFGVFHINIYHFILPTQQKRKKLNKVFSAV